MKAFTLVEVLFSLLIIILISGFIISFILSLSNYNIFFIFNIGSQREIDFTLNNMRKELRGMKYSNTGVYPIEFASDTSIIFYSDIDNDGLSERLRYFLEDNKLKRGVVKPLGTPLYYDLSKEKIWTMVNNVEDFKISYYDETFDNSPTSTPLSFPTDISRIRVIKVEIQTKPYLGKPSIYNHILVSPRIFKTK